MNGNILTVPFTITFSNTFHGTQGVWGPAISTTSTVEGLPRLGTWLP
jgi:hypothetical protein